MSRLSLVFQVIVSSPLLGIAAGFVLGCCIFGAAEAVRTR